MLYNNVYSIVYFIMRFFVCFRWYMRAPRQSGFDIYIYIYINAYFMKFVYIHVYFLSVPSVNKVFIIIIIIIINEPRNNKCVNKQTT